MSGTSPEYREKEGKKRKEKKKNQRINLNAGFSLAVYVPCVEKNKVLSCCFPSRFCARCSSTRVQGVNGYQFSGIKTGFHVIAIKYQTIL